MGKHDIGSKRHKGSIFGLKLSAELGYNINDVMGEMIFDNVGNRIDPEKKHLVTEEEFYEMRRKIGRNI